MHRLLGKGNTSGAREAHGPEARVLRSFESEKVVRASGQDHGLRLAVMEVDLVVPPLHCPLQ